MAKDKNTARRPNIHWYMKDLRDDGFVAAFEEHCKGDTILGLYLPRAFMAAWATVQDPTATDRQVRLAEEAMRANGPELTIRENDEERTLYGTYNYSHTCPPDCS